MSLTYNDRVRVLAGEHAGRIGKVIITEADQYAKTWGVNSGQVLVALDGEPGKIATAPHSIARGGRGGVSLVFEISNLDRIV